MESAAAVQRAVMPKRGSSGWGCDGDGAVRLAGGSRQATKQAKTGNRELELMNLEAIL